MEPFPPQPPPPYVPDVAVIEPEDPELGPCDDAQSREEVDADAAAAKALEEFKAWASRSNEPLELREYWAYLYRTPNGEIAVSNPVRGDPYTATVDPWTAEAFEGVPVRDIVGFIHNHPGAGPNQAPPTGTSSTSCSI